jgi:hypothetical protein
LNGQKHTLDDLGKQSSLKEAKEPEPEPKEKTMAVLKLTERLGLTEAGIEFYDDVDNAWRVLVVRRF